MMLCMCSVWVLRLWWYPHHNSHHNSHHNPRNSSNTNTNTNNRNNNSVFIKLPFVDDTQARKISGSARTSGLPVRIAWTNTKTLKNTLVRSALNPTPCPSGGRRCHACHAGLAGQCHSKNVVYGLECSLCGDRYIGETKRPLRLRYNEHLRDGTNKTRDTPLGDHFADKHPQDNATDTTLAVKIIRKCIDEADRKIAESVAIRDATPTLNTYTASWPILRIG